MTLQEILENIYERAQSHAQQKFGMNHASISINHDGRLRLEQSETICMETTWQIEVISIDEI